MFRILQNCISTIRKSFEGFDLEEGGRSFEELIDIVTQIGKWRGTCKRIYRMFYSLSKDIFGRQT